MPTGLNFVVNGADYSGSGLGIVNANPPQGLPAGCDLFLLTVRNADLAVFDRIGGATLPNAVVGTVEYLTDRAKTDVRVDGINLTGITNVYGAEDNGFTALAVTALRNQAGDPAAGGFQSCFSNIGYTNGVSGWAIIASSTQAGASITSLAGDAQAQPIYTVSGLDTDELFAVFGTFDASVGSFGSLNVDIPHSNQGGTANLASATRTATDRDSGLTMLRENNLGANRHATLTLAARWTRPLSAGERNTAYAVVKAWLANLGISIA